MLSSTITQCVTRTLREIRTAAADEQSDTPTSRPGAPERTPAEKRRDSDVRHHHPKD